MHARIRRLLIAQRLLDALVISLLRCVLRGEAAAADAHAAGGVALLLLHTQAATRQNDDWERGGRTVRGSTTRTGGCAAGRCDASSTRIPVVVSPVSSHVACGAGRFPSLARLVSSSSRRAVDGPPHRAAAAAGVDPAQPAFTLRRARDTSRDQQGPTRMRTRTAGRQEERGKTTGGRICKSHVLMYVLIFRVLSQARARPCPLTTSVEDRRLAGLALGSLIADNLDVRATVPLLLQ